MTTKATRPRRVTILRAGNQILVDSRSRRVQRLLAAELTYAEKVFLRGRELQHARKHRLPPVREEPCEAFFPDPDGRIGTCLGYLDRIEALLARHGYKTTVRVVQPPPRPEAYVPHWDRIDGDPEIKLRHKQREALQIFVDHENGRIDCPPGWGKSFTLALAGRLLPRAKIVITTDRVPVLCERIYPEICTYLPDVGVRGGGMSRNLNARVLCSTIDSLHHADAQADYVFVDECHEAGSDTAARQLSRFEHARLFGLSASQDMRLDGKDFRIEGIFGPVRLKVTMDEAVAHKMVVPVEIRWGNVFSDIDPCAGVADPVARERAGIWTNEHRNAVIAQDARQYGASVQLLITVRTLEHALHLKRFLPEFSLVYDGQSVPESDWEYYDKHGLLPDDFRPMTPERRRKLAARFARGKLGKVIATTVWNVGVSMSHLRVLIRGDAGGSPINDVQIPGRTTRLADGKFVAVVHDYLDQFNSGFAAKALRRMRTYKDYGYTQRMPAEGKQTRLRRLMRWDDLA